MTVVYNQSINLDEETYKFLDELKKKHRISKSETVRKLLRQYLGEEEKILKIIEGEN
jgi:metal-responsive CopG/Arc/MetJ family transcriptional regulator